MFDDSTADFNPPPKHKIDDKKPVNLGVDYGEEDENKGAKKGAK